MKTILIDLNIIIYALNGGKYHEESATIMDLCEKKIITGYICAHEITTLSYFLGKASSNISTQRTIINNLLDIFSTIQTTEKILRDSLDSKITDFEDAVIETSAIQNNIEYIVSHNLKDFKLSKVKAITPQEFLTNYF